MRTGYLRLDGGREIPVHVGSRAGNILVECHDAAAFLRKVTSGRLSPDLPPDSYLRGVIFGGHDAVLQLFDRLGRVSSEIHLDEAEARALVQSLC